MEKNHTHRHDVRRPGFRWKVARLIMLGIGGVAFAALFALILGIVVQWLWNWLMPDIFGLKQISYWEAFGLLFLARLLFGGFGHHHRPHRPGRSKSCHDRDHSDHWKKYGHFWQEKGDAAADDLIGRAQKETPGEQAQN